MTGAGYIAEFLARVGSDRVFVLTGGACAFMVDAVACHPRLSYTCFHHEQSAAMAADALWRVSGKVGVTMATSGPGATNLITGIACSYFDSIPSMHITGQVNQRESSAYHGVNVRQSGFQETRIADMIRPVTKYAVAIRNVEELRTELPKAYAIATGERMGPVLIDVPIDIQQESIDSVFEPIPRLPAQAEPADHVASQISATIAKSSRPVVLWGAGIALAGIQKEVSTWLRETGLPFVSSWGGLTYFDHHHPGFVGQIGVYGNRGANFVLQNADVVLVLGSRLDNRQRSGNAGNFARGATVHVVDVDREELRKYRADGYRTSHLDLRSLPTMLPSIAPPAENPEWRAYIAEMKERYCGTNKRSPAHRRNSLSPYEVISRLAELIAEDAMVAVDTGACMCWVFQAFPVKRHRLFTAGGHSPMGYALPAIIGAKLDAPSRQAVAFLGDGGFQLNIQELQTIKHHSLDIVLVVMNNRSYGIIKQFQDSYLGKRHYASFDGYSTPDFGRIAEAYRLSYARVERLEDISAKLFDPGPRIVEVVISENALIEPKLEMGRPINDQFPYVDAAEYASGNRFVHYPRPSLMRQQP